MSLSLLYHCNDSMIARSMANLQVGKHGQQLLAPAPLESGKVVDPAVRNWCEGYGAALAACQSDGGAWQPSSAARTSQSPPTVLARPWSTSETDLSVKSKDAGDPASREHTTLEVLECGGEGTEIDRNVCLDRAKVVGSGAGGGGSSQSAGQVCYLCFFSMVVLRCLIKRGCLRNG